MFPSICRKPDSRPDVLHTHTHTPRSRHCHPTARGGGRRAHEIIKSASHTPWSTAFMAQNNLETCKMQISGRYIQPLNQNIWRGAWNPVWLLQVQVILTFWDFTGWAICPRSSSSEGAGRRFPLRSVNSSVNIFALPELPSCANSLTFYSHYQLEILE